MTQAGKSATESGRLVAIAANPYSGSRRAYGRVQTLLRALRRHGLEPQVAWSPAERATLVRQTGCRCVVAAGGDGTVSDVINERPGAPLAVLPMGNENLFARELGFTPDTERLARAILRRRWRRMDLVQAGGRLFSLMVTAGLDAAVAHKIARTRLRHGAPGRVNRFSYAKPILGALRSYTYERLSLEADGIEVQGAHVLVFNAPQYGMQLEFAPEARADDGLLDWVVFQRPGVRRLGLYLWAVLRSRHLRRADVLYGQAQRIGISAAAPVPVQGDGDPAGTTPIELEVAPEALRVIISEAK